MNYQTSTALDVENRLNNLKQILDFLKNALSN